ncbi:MAG: response regulator [Actinobacteria bacterium]|nr:response regulator [Actinomycetota bacterium]MBE3115425.1 response regulator [Actinomycetota bacterium]
MRDKVLIIDDEEVIRKNLKKLLILDGYEVFTAEDGKQGLNIFHKMEDEKQNPIKVALVDIRMPGMDGIEALKRIKKNNTQTEVIIITGHGEIESAIQALKIGAFDYVTKPIEYDELALSISRALERYEMKWKLDRLTQDLEKANKELHRRLHELSILYDLSKGISYTLDYEQLLRLIMDSLYKVIDYHVCSSLILSKEEGKLNIRVTYPVSDSFIQDVKSKIIWSVTSLTGRTFKKEHVSVVMERGRKTGSEERGIKELVRSFFNVPLISGERLVGMINISSLKENAFTDADIRFIYTLANQTSVAIERLRAVITAEKSKMETMVESMVEGIIMIDNEEKLVIINPAAKSLLGFNRDEQVTIKQLIQSFKEAEGEKLFNKEISSAAEEVSIEVHITKPRPCILYITRVLAKGEKGERLGFVITIRDITEEKEVDQMKNEFISTVSHELRTPLSIIKEGTDLVLDEIPGKINEKQGKILTIAKNNIDRLARIINDLLDISKIEAGKIELKKEPVNITNLIEQVASSFENGIKGRGLELKVSSPKEEIDVYAEADKIIQVFTNLLGNALKFTEKGYIEISAKELGEEIECVVSDTGRGISKDDLPKVFKKFQQFGRVNGEGEKGTGLGLSIAKEIVEMHNGKIWAESTPGKGSKFIFTLPKYTTEVIFKFKECVNNGIRKAKKKDSKVSLILISILKLDKLKQYLSSQILDSTLKDMERALRDTLRLEGDVVMRNVDEIMVLLSDCNKENVPRVKCRLEKILDNCLKQRNLAKKIKLHFGYATYPDEGLRAGELVKKAEKASSG